MATRRRPYSPVASAPRRRPERPTLKTASRWGTFSGRARLAAVVETAKSGTATAAAGGLGGARAGGVEDGARGGGGLGEGPSCRGGRGGEVGDGDGRGEVLGFEADGAY